MVLVSSVTDQCSNNSFPQPKTFSVEIDDPLIRPQRIYGCIYEIRCGEQGIKTEEWVDCDGESCRLSLDLSHIAYNHGFMIKAYQWIGEAWECVGSISGKSSDLLNFRQISIQGF